MNKVDLDVLEARFGYCPYASTGGGSGLCGAMELCDRCKDTLRAARVEGHELIRRLRGATEMLERERERCAGIVEESGWVGELDDVLKAVAESIRRRATSDTLPPCIGGNPGCPCQDGLLCHYKGESAWPIPQ